MSEYFPSADEFERHCKNATVVPVHREVIADRLTPVLAQATVGKDAGSYLLESVVGGEKWGRYSFVGFAPEVIVRGVADKFERVLDGEVYQELGVWQLLHQAAGTGCRWRRLHYRGKRQQRRAAEDLPSTHAYSRRRSPDPHRLDSFHS